MERRFFKMEHRCSKIDFALNQTPPDTTLKTAIDILIHSSRFCFFDSFIATDASTMFI